MAVGGVFDDCVGSPLFAIPHGADECVVVVDVDDKQVGNRIGVGFDESFPECFLPAGAVDSVAQIIRR
ncbi:hypothetical protein HMPREF2857_07175 [Corynebacterium sp. HMSC076C10]|nr:hypothetical protein HMPREF2857_07175 [Corynebacterium sp. HMSC076C10]